jgi:malonyl-CoA/methylmalonyl-CoA synthetase
VLEVKGPNVFSGYWRRPELTATEFRSDGFFISGDMATVSASGRIKIVGRNRDLIISGGLNVYPNEIEDSLNILPGIIESAVIGVIHPDLGESVVACIVTEASFKCDENEIIDALKNQLASYKVPRRIIRLESLPKNIMGKIQKNMLRQRYSVLP